MVSASLTVGNPAARGGGTSLGPLLRTEPLAEWLHGACPWFFTSSVPILEWELGALPSVEAWELCVPTGPPWSLLRGEVWPWPPQG